ncbi:MAG: hypothetical protein A4S09_15425 [Proteobacteria bacterium SG_bin7]|nr:MAG: hypothetical protein A4S09_15425 [Proteobacteria bacterium SG_bin7]
MFQIDTRLKLLVMTLLIVACGGAGNQSVSINVSSTAFLIAFGNDTVFPDGDPCYSGQTFSPPRFTISKVTTTWKGEGNYRPTYILISLNATGNNSNYQCAFTAAAGNDSIAQALGFPTPEINTIGQAYVSNDSVCSLICGSFPITNKNSPLSVSGQVKLYGIVYKTVNGQPVDFQISTQDFFTLQYSP